MTIRALREMGHDVLDVRASPDRGAPDGRVWDMACAEGRLLITTDRGFAQRRRDSHAGILIVALRQPNRNRIHDRIMQAMARFPAVQWPGLLVVCRDRTVSDWRVRD